MNLNLNMVITPQTVYEVKGEGMPLLVQSDDKNCNNTKNVADLPKGNLYITFDIVFP